MYSMRTYDSFIHGVLNDIRFSDAIHTKKKIEYLQVSCAFDTETTSTYINGEKVAFMYIWQFGINGYMIYGRTWEEFQVFIYMISKALGLGEKRKIICYVHNLAYDFQFMRFWFRWCDVFALRNLTPVSAEMEGYGVIFRCSYILTGCSLAMLARKLRGFDCLKKRIGSLDYSLVRHSDSRIYSEEKGYCMVDIAIIMAYIAQCMDDERGVENIPRTKTGYVRRRCRDFALYHKEITDKKERDRQMFRYRKMVNMLSVEPNEYTLLKQAFAGGFTHANCHHVGDKCDNVASFDFSSSYPAVMTLDYFPMSRGHKVQISSRAQYEEYCRKYCVVAYVTFYNLRPKLDYEFYISKSKGCNWIYKDAVAPGGKPVIDRKTGKPKQVIDGVFDNGRVVKTPRVTVAITEIDYDIISHVYDFDAIGVGECYIYTRGRLPSDLIKIVADLYNAKTTLKGVAGREREYLLKKEDINSMYGMLVTDILRDEFAYTDDWQPPRKPDAAEKIAEYNKSFSRFSFYGWGIYVTAHARRRLWSGILECGHDFIYADTDSIKIFNKERHMPYINSYNNQVVESLKAAAEWHRIPLEMFMPKTIKDATKILGVWDYEGDYDHFKTLGAKRYMVEKDGIIKITVAGVNPDKGAKYLSEHFGAKAFDAFDHELTIPAEHTGKLTHTYIDKEIEGDILDYEGRKGHYHERSFVHLSPADYSLTLAAEFVEFLKGVDEFFEI